MIALEQERFSLQAHGSNQPRAKPALRPNANENHIWGERPRSAGKMPAPRVTTANQRRPKGTRLSLARAARGRSRYDRAHRRGLSFP